MCTYQEFGLGESSMRDHHPPQCLTCGRTISHATMEHFPTAIHPDRKLRATFSRAIYSGVARTLNMAMRRLQISAAARVAVPAIPAFALRLPPASAGRRSFPKSPLPLIRHESYLRARLAQVLRPVSDELTSSPRRLFGPQCVADESEEID